MWVWRLFDPNFYYLCAVSFRQALVLFCSLGLWGQQLVFGYICSSIVFPALLRELQKKATVSELQRTAKVSHQYQLPV